MNTAHAVIPIEEYDRLKNNDLNWNNVNDLYNKAIYENNIMKKCIIDMCSKSQMNLVNPISLLNQYGVSAVETHKVTQEIIFKELCQKESH